MAMTFETNVVVNAGNSVKANAIQAPTTSGGTTYGAGTAGQVLKTNGTTVYWADDDAGTAITNAEIDALFTQEDN